MPCVAGFAKAPRGDPKAHYSPDRAVRDAEEIVDYYLTEGSEQAVMGFIDALERAYVHIGENPATGSSRYAVELNLQGLRSWPLTNYPYLIFYVEGEEHIRVVPLVT